MIETPVVLIYTEQSAFIDTFEYLEQHLPNVHAALLPKTEWGHFGPMEQPELVARAILERLPAAAAVEIRGD